MKKWSNKTLTLLVSIVLLAVNGGLLFSYYNFYLSDKMANDLSSARTENHNSIYVITRSIEGKTKDEALDLIRLYVKNNGGYITIKDSSGNIIYTNSKDTSKIFSTTTMISIDGDNYELTYSKISVAPGIKIFRNFMIYEIIIVSGVIIILFFISSKQLIDPIETITKDINDYRFGKRPFKRKMPRKMQQIQNAFVDMVDSLELEKENQNQYLMIIKRHLLLLLVIVID